MSKLSQVRDVILSIRQSGVKEVGLVQLAEEINQQIGMTMEDTVRRYLRGFLASEIPTEKIRKGVYRFISEPTQETLFKMEAGI